MMLFKKKGFSLIETAIAISIIILIVSVGIGCLSAQRVSRRAIDSQFAILLSDIRFLQDKARARGATQTIRLSWEKGDEYMLIGEDTCTMKIRKFPGGMTIRGDGLRGRILEFYPSGVVGPQAGGLIMENGLYEYSVHFNIGTGAAKIERN